jgi:predicted O-methyltransferase YrrM
MNKQQQENHLLLSELLRRIPSRHKELSIVHSKDDHPQSNPTEELVTLALSAITLAKDVTLTDVIDRIDKPPYYPAIWPGEHYKLLAGLVKVLKPKVIVEIGTGQGYGTLSLRSTLPESSKVYTFDTIPYQNITGTVLREEDMLDGSITCITADLSLQFEFQKYSDILSRSTFIFIDGPKDGVTEGVLYQAIRVLKQKKNIRETLGESTQKTLLIFDDIRLLNMIHFWKLIEKPKLDLTSFGHWSGTGIVIM